MINRKKVSGTIKLLVSLLLVLSITSCWNRNKSNNKSSDPDNLAVLEEFSEGDSKLNNINSPLIENWSPEMLSIHFTGSNTVDGPLHFKFNLPMVHEDSLEHGKFPKVHFEPALQGVFKWDSNVDMVFHPEPGQLNYGELLNIRIDSAVPLPGEAYALPRVWQIEYVVPFFQMAGKIASWPVQTGAPKFVSFLNWRSGEVGAGPVYMLYDQPVKLEDVKKLIEITKEDGTPVRSTIFRPDHIQMVTDDEVVLDHIIGFQVMDLPGEGESLTIEVPSWHKTGGLYSENHYLKVRKEFRMRNAYANHPWYSSKTIPVNTDWHITFSNWVSIAQFKKAVSIDPEPVSVYFSNSGDHDWSNGGYLSVNTLKLELKPGTDYTISLSKDLTDVLGNKLGMDFDTSFRTKDLPPVLELPSEALLLESEAKTFPIRTQNLSSVQGELYQFSSEEAFAKALLMGKKSKPGDYGLSGAKDKFTIAEHSSSPNKVEIMEGPLPGGPGLYCVQVIARGTGSEAGSRGDNELSELVLIQSTDIGITSKIYQGGVFTWLTSLKDAGPIANKKVRLHDGSKVIAEAITDANGVADLSASGLLLGNTLKKPLLVIAGEGKTASVARLVNNELSNAWQFGLHGNVKGYSPLNAVIFTDRGVYRPGETTHVKFILEKGSGSKSAYVKVNDPRGQQLMEKELKLDEFNSASIDIKLKDQAAVGEYNIIVSSEAGTTTRTFRVEEYRVPTFRVTVDSDKDAWKINQLVEATIEAKYLHGGSLDGREVKWMVTREPLAFTHRSFPQYIFSWNKGPNFAGTVTSGNKRLDGKGKLNIRFTPNNPPSAGAMQYTIESTVTDIDRQAYAGRIAKVIHPAGFYIGLKPPSRSILSTGETLKVPVITVNTSKEIESGHKVNILLERIDNHTAARLTHQGNVQMLNRPEPVKIHYYEIKTGNTPGILEFNMKEAGYYRISAWSKDDDGKVVQTGFEFTVSGDNPIAWPRFDQERIDIVTDKNSYKPGDEARLVIKSPYESARGILTIERNNVISYQLFEIDKNTPKIKVPITEDFAPNVFVSMLIIRGRVHHEKDASGFETGAPGLKIGYANLLVEAEHRKLTVNTTLDKTTAIPGEKVKISLDVKDFQKQAAPGQVTLMVVDEAVLGLTAYKTPDPLSQLYAEGLLGIRTGSNLLDLPHAKRSRLEKIFPGGDADMGDMQSRFPAELRKLFKSTAYYNPNILLDNAGKAEIEVELPDNLTTFRVMAIAVDKDQRVGADDEQIEVRQPLMVQPVIPRFAYPDDEFVVEALVYNGSNRSATVEVLADFEGLELMSGKPAQSLKLKGNSSGKVSFPVKVLREKEITIRFAAAGKVHKDAVEISIPILEPGTKVNIVENKNVSGTGSISLEIPSDHIQGSAAMEVVLSTTSLSELKDAVQYLMRYPNGCIEQTTSTAYPLVVLRDLLPEIGVEVNMDDLKSFSEAGVRRILSFQTTSGGLAYWPGSDQPHAFATAFGLTALIEAKKKGYNIPDEALAGMANYLEKSLREGKISGEMPHGGMADADTRALFVMTLGRLGRPQPGYISLLWEKRSELTPFGLSLLAIAIKENPGDKSLLQPVLALIEEAARKDSEEAWYEGNPSGGWSFDSPLRTHASALLAYASANQGDAMTGKYLKGLLNRRESGMWGNTQENVFGIMGVHKAATTKSGANAPAMTVKVNNDTYDDTQMEKNSSQVRRLKLVEEDLNIQAGKPSPQQVQLTTVGSIPVIFTVRMQYDLPLTPERMKAASNGFTIEREYETLNGKSLEGKDIKLGTLVRVRVKVKTAMEHHYVAIDDKLPAGLEPLNTSLSTTEKVDQGKLNAEIQRGLSVLSYSEIRDSRVAFYVDEMIPGEYEFSYVARATTPGKYLRPAGLAEAMYQPEIFGKTASDYISVVE